jgi:hypothetical protein
MDVDRNGFTAKHGMCSLQNNLSGACRMSFDPDSADSAALGERERIVANQNAGAGKFESDVATREEPGRTKFIGYLNDNTGCVNPIPYYREIVSIQ